MKKLLIFLLDITVSAGIPLCIFWATVLPFITKENAPSLTMLVIIPLMLTSMFNGYITCYRFNMEGDGYPVNDHSDLFKALKVMVYFDKAKESWWLYILIMITSPILVLFSLFKILFDGIKKICIKTV